MKKTLRVNISGSVLMMDEDAFQKLDSYLDTIKRHYGNNAEAKEIVSDFENRIAELLLEKITASKQSVNYADVSEVISVLGYPDDYTADEQRRGGKSYSRIYRDPDDRILGGVCSGLGHYFHVDPVLIRILLLVSVFVFGAGTLLYLILWLVVPVANTPAQKLEMRGEPITFENINSAVKNEFDEVRRNWKRNK